MLEKNNFDYLVIGAGSGGIATANRAASHGKRVALIEKNIIGGTCVNVGCVPKKIMWYASQIADAVKFSKFYGFNIDHDYQIKKFNWKNLIANRNSYIERVHNSYNNSFKKNNISIIKGEASFTGTNSVEISGSEYFAKHICIATGGIPKIPDVQGSEYGITSNGFFELAEKPKSVIIVGSGYIAVELASFLNSIGTRVTLVIRKSRILTNFDETIAISLQSTMQEKGINLILNSEARQITKQKKSKLKIDFGNKTLETDHLIWAIGRNPNTDQVNADLAGVNLDSKGYIPVDKYQNTNVPGIYAVGDNTGNIQLTPVAVAAGRKLADRLFNNQLEAYISSDNVASVIFSDPPIGTVGLSEAQAVNSLGKENIKIYISKFKAMYPSVANYAAITTIKMITEAHSDKIIGLHIVGIGADEMLQGFAVAIKMGATKSQFDQTMAIHPTSAEEVVLIK